MADPINKPLVEDAAVPTGAEAVPAKVRHEAAVASIESERERERNDLAAVLATDEGKRVLLRVLKHCQPYRETVLSTNAEQYLLAEGRRGVGHWLIRDVLGAFSADAYPNLLLYNARIAQERADLAAGTTSASAAKARRR